MGIVLLALALRVWALGSVPPGVDVDEASIGYNALSIARTGRDEYGAFLPTAFAAFGEFKRPAYIYLTAPFVGLFGLSPFTVRLPAALLGALSVVVLYTLARRLLENRRQALLAAGLLAISPWHLQFTRAAREASLLVLAILLLVWALLEALATPDRPRVVSPAPEGAAVRRRRTRWLVGAAGAFLLALYTYPGALLLAPLVALVVARAYWPGVRTLPRPALLAAGIVVLAGSLPLIAQLVDGRARARLSQASLLNEPAISALSQTRLAREREAGGAWLLQTPLAVAARQTVDNYLSHYGPGYLFTRGDSEWRHHSSDTAQLYLWDAPLLLAGLYVVWRNRRIAAMQALGGWLLVAPIPAAFAERAPHAVRSIGLLPALMLLAAVGAPPLWSWLSARRLHKDWLLLLGLSVGFYLYAYYRHYPVEQGRAWNAGLAEGYRAALALADEPSDPYRRIVIPEEMGLSYVYALFGTRYDPASYLSQGGTRLELPPGADPRRVRMTIAPFEIRAVEWGAETRDPTVLYVLDGPARPPAGTETVHLERSPDGTPILQLVRFAGGRS